jgi:hypothetical protein
VNEEVNPNAALEVFVKEFMPIVDKLLLILLRMNCKSCKNPLD